jgi:phenylacetic acid degradation operon negative regulatory protein
MTRLTANGEVEHSSGMSKRIDWYEVLDVLVFVLDKFTRPTFNNLMTGLEEDRYRTYGPKLFFLMERERYIERTRRGKHLEFTVAEECKRPRVNGRDPKEEWERKWDGRWRLLTFDVPESRSKDRLKLWRHLRARNVGFLQKSVWIWPRDMNPMLTDILDATGIPECFAGFETSRLFLCTHQEIVTTAWDFDAILAGHQKHLDQISKLQAAVSNARTLAQLVEVGRAEWRSYRDSMWSDPLLPNALLPPGYLGARVYEAHQSFRRHFARCLRGFIEV